MPRAVIPPAVMTPDGRYDDRWKRWCTDHGVSLLAFLREAERRRARYEAVSTNVDTAS